MDASTKPDYGDHNRWQKGQKGKWAGKTCQYEGCDKPVVCRGYCNSHYHKIKWASGYRTDSHTNPDKLRERHLKHRYGITLAEYNAMLAAQDGKCAICQRTTDGDMYVRKGATFCVDHNHDSGKVRGLLCHDCNLAVGYVKTTAVAESLLEYLRLHNG